MQRDTRAAAAPRPIRSLPRALLIPAALLLAGCLAPATLESASPSEPLVRAAFDTLICAKQGACTVRATTDAQATEIDLATNPDDPLHLVAVSKAVGRDKVAVAVSRDGGATWKQGWLPLDQDLESDPVVAFAPDGAVLVITLAVRPVSPVSVSPDNLLAYRSEDGGETFAFVADATPPGLTADKEWLAVDRARGIVYLSTSLFPDDAPQGLHVVRSEDGGRTWGTPVLACEACFIGSIALGPEGDLHLAALRFPDQAAGRMREQVVHAVSRDGAATWSEAVVLEEDASSLGSQLTCHTRQSRFTSPPMVGVDPVDGRVHVVYGAHATALPTRPWGPTGECPNVPDWDVVLRSSANAGATWSSRLVVNDDGDALAAQGTPMLRVGPWGELHVAWYDQRADPTGRTTEVYYAHSADGRTFSPNLRVTDRPFPDNGNVNDYLGLVADHRRAVLAFVVAEGESASEIVTARIV